MSAITIQDAIRYPERWKDPVNRQRSFLTARGEAGRAVSVDKNERADERADPLSYRFTRRSRSALPMTETELNVIAALAMIGLNRTRNRG